MNLGVWGQEPQLCTDEVRNLAARESIRKDVITPFALSRGLFPLLHRSSDMDRYALMPIDPAPEDPVFVVAISWMKAARYQVRVFKVKDLAKAGTMDADKAAQLPEDPAEAAETLTQAVAAAHLIERI